MTEEAKRSLAEFLPHLKLAIAMARIEAGPEGKTELGVLGVHPDGSGQIVARFETEFVADLEKLVTGDNAPIPAEPESCGITGCDKPAQPGDALCRDHRKIVSFDQACRPGLVAQKMEEIAQRLFTTLNLAICGGTDDKGKWNDDWAAKGAIRQALDDVFELATEPNGVQQGHEDPARHE